MHRVQSSSIDAVGYDPLARELYVRFLQSGDTYVYRGVEDWVFEDLMVAESKGGYLNTRIKGRYDYAKV